MKSKITYTDEPMIVGPRVFDFLPSPEELVIKEDSQKITLALTAQTLKFFKREAHKHRVSYQKMIRNLLDHYARQASKLK